MGKQTSIALLDIYLRKCGECGLMNTVISKKGNPIWHRDYDNPKILLCRFCFNSKTSKRFSLRGLAHPMYGRRGQDNPQFGKVGYMHGRFHTVETKLRISQGLKSSGRTWKKGFHHSEEIRRKMSFAHIGKHYNFSITGLQILTEGRRGEKNPSWKGGVNSIRDAIRHLPEYENWRRVIYRRDNYACQNCGSKRVLTADHIKPFSQIIHESGITTTESAQLCTELWDIKNGRTLCRACHQLTPTFGGRMNAILAVVR